MQGRDDEEEKKEEEKIYEEQKKEDSTDDEVVRAANESLDYFNKKTGKNFGGPALLKNAPPPRVRIAGVGSNREGQGARF